MLTFTQQGRGDFPLRRVMTVTAPRRKLASPVRWLLTTKDPVPPSIGAQLESGLFASLPIFLGGVLNSIAIAAIAAWRHSTDAFIAWLLLEMSLALVRLPMLVHGRRAIAAGREPPTTLAVMLACGWAASVGYGAFISLTSGDWVLATVVCLSAAAMVCGICLRNFGTPRLAAAMGLLTLVPCAVGGLLAREPMVAVIGLQLPIFLVTIFGSAFSLHHLMVSRMTALSDLQRSEFFNRTILESSPDYTLIVDQAHKVVFCNRPNGGSEEARSLIGVEWLSLLPPEDREDGRRVLAAIAAGKAANLVSSHVDEAGKRRWFDVVANRIQDDSGRILMVARDITHQKRSEEHALWMARHDPLTRLPNRAVLQDQLDARLIDSHAGKPSALLIVDVDHFKAINDTLGHDAGDALLCDFADRLSASVADSDLVTRTGGDEFALLISGSEDEVAAIAERIYAALGQPFVHEGRVLQCGASIGASLLPRDGATRSEIMKAADIALYAAKAGGRSRLKLFEPSMKAEVEQREAMLASARNALGHERVEPYFQPQVSLLTSRVVGFEALLRWRDESGALRGPDELRAAFEDPALGRLLSERMIEQTLGHMQAWLLQGVEFGYVAINATAADFRRENFAADLIAQLAARSIPPWLLQVEVTETVFLGRGADHVEIALRALSDAGIGIALDDFGTGYASLSHLNQFPVDLLKIDRSFIRDLGRQGDAEAIAGAVVHLGHCLGLEVVAEGIETVEQEAQLIAFGCNTGQGFLYSEAVPADQVPALLSGWELGHRPGPVADAA